MSERSKNLVGRTSLAIIGALALVFYAGCGAQTEGDPAAGERVFDVRGIVRAIAEDRETITVAHEEIPGFMPAMTMPFYLKEPSLADGLAPGDPVAFRFVVGENNSWIDRIEKVDASEVEVSVRDLAREPDPLRARMPRLEEGDPAPSFRLVNQDGEAFETARFSGSAVVMTFIFTRCPVPEFCPLMSSNFQAIQRKLKEEPGLRERTHLMSVTIDPAYDTPEVLREYAGAWTDSTENWTFATGDQDRIDEMTTRFSVFIDPDSAAGSIDHALATVLIGPDGRVEKIWRGNRWTPEEVLEEVSTALEGTQN
jgi:protein SCO1